MGPYVPTERTAKTQADLFLRWEHSHFVAFVMSRLIIFYILSASGSLSTLVTCLSHVCEQCFMVNCTFYLSHLMRLWHFSSSVISFFKCACAAIQWG